MPENGLLYGMVSQDSTIGDLERDIREHCVREPLVISRDRYIVSGHRRRLAALRAGQQAVPCHVLAVRYSAMTPDERIALLRAHNIQCDKTVSQIVREEMIGADPENCAEILKESERDSVDLSSEDFTIVSIEYRAPRPQISDDKQQHVGRILELLETLRDYLPLSSRTFHYHLSEDTSFVRGYFWPRAGQPGHGKRKTLWYANDDGSYIATCNLLMRLRLNGTVPWSAICDETRPLKQYHAFMNAREFIEQENERYLTGYWRNLQQSQPKFIVSVCEKNTFFHLAQRVTDNYHVPILSSRGFSGIDAWHDIYELYKASGKKLMSVVMLTDYDPEGERMVQACGQTLVHDFGVPYSQLEIVKAGITPNQILKHNLPAQNFAKEDSKNFDWFIARHFEPGSTAAYELEALHPQLLMDHFDEAIRFVLDIDLFNREQAEERKESEDLKDKRERAFNLLRSLWLAAK
jgi:hypothetical protein